MTIRRAMLLLAAGTLAPAALVHAKPGPEDAGRLLALGDSLLEAGDYDGAEASYAGIASWGWTSGALAHNRGLAALRAGRAGEAVAHLLDARRLAPRDAAIQQSLAAARAQAGIAARPAASSGRVFDALGSPGGIIALVVLAAVSGFAAVVQRRRREVALVLALGAVGAWCGAGAAWLAAAPRATVAARTSLRAAPAVAAGERMELRPGRSLRVGVRHGAWLRARVPGGPAGWVPASALVD
jgi:hypothetical protein